MNLKFPDLDTLRLALTTGAVPSEVSTQSASYAYDDEDVLWVESEGPLPRGASPELKKLGVHVSRSTGPKEKTVVLCWAQLLPLQPDPEPIAHLEQTPVLFQLDSGEQLAQLSTEILRLGNDRQRYRWLERNDGNSKEAQSLLHVVEPPYYSLLRALDRKNKAVGPIAFVEAVRNSNVWIEMGYTHPLADQLEVPEGQMLLLRPKQNWLILDNETFRDIYEVMEFTVDRPSAPWKEGKLDRKLTVNPTLKPGGSTEAAELWVLRDNPIQELNQLVQGANDRILHELAFAVGEQNGERSIVLRLRQARPNPPVLVVNGIGYRRYLKIDNLFLPVGTRLHPPLRRDKVRQLLAEEQNNVVWLAPQEDGEFVPETLPANSFRPLWDWIDYVLDHDFKQLEAWTQAAQFDFEPFVCDEDDEGRPKRSSSNKGKGKGDSRSDKEVPSGPIFEFTDVQKGEAPPQVEDEEEELLDSVSVEPSQLQIELGELEATFISMEGGLDAEERVKTWPRLASLNSALRNVEESGICWSNALWWQKTPSREQAWNWFCIETQGIPARKEKGLPKGRNWTSKASLSGKKNREIPDEDLDRLLELEEPATADIRAFCAYLVWASRLPEASQPLQDRLNPAQRFLEEHERVVPVRFAWLAWRAMARLAGEDELTLARARDRILERLFQNGLRPEQDLPSFLRFAGQPTNQRFRAVRSWLTQLEEKAELWTLSDERELDAPKTHLTLPYVQMIFAFGLARLGETDASNALLDRAKNDLSNSHDVHETLMQGYEYRIKQALEGKPHTGPLRPEYLEYLEEMERMPRYVVDRLRQHSRILEPHEEIDPYRHWGARISDLDRALAELTDMRDREEIASKVRQLFKDAPKGARGAEHRARVVRSALDVAPRVSEEFAREMLGAAPEVYDKLSPPGSDPVALLDRARFLEFGLMTAAHFDQVAHIRPMVARFQQLLESQRGEKAVRALESLAGKCFRGLRKLGMREEIDGILAQMADLVLEGRDVKSLDAKSMKADAWRALLHVASGWYYFGRDQQAERVISAVRSALFKGDIEVKEKTRLICAYAQTVGQAPVEFAQRRLEELFEKLPCIRDTYTTNTYYSLSQLDVIEAVVLAVVSDDFTLGSQARRWLDDDEYLVRKRIHRDVRGMTSS